MSYTYQQINGFDTHIYETNKFKSVSVSIHFRNKVCKETLAYRALLPAVLSAGSKKYPSKRAISLAFEKLYSTKFAAGIRRSGISYIISFAAFFLDDKYTSSKRSIFNESINLLNEIIQNPLIENNSFKKDIVEKEKKLMIDQVKSIYDNKSLYSLLELKKVMFEGEISSITEKDLLDKLDEVTPQNLYEYYLKMINEDKIDVLIGGNIDQDNINHIQKHFDFKERVLEYEVMDYSEKEISEVKEINEIQDIKQGQLNIGFRTRIRAYSEQSPAMIVFNKILGGYSSSKLFINVREKESLCYSIYSSTDNEIGFLYIKLGIDPDNYQLAKDLVLKQIDDIKNNNFSDEDIIMAKENIISNYMQSQDSLNSIMNKIYIDILYKVPFDLDRLPNKINQVTREDIVNIASKLELDTIFFLTNKEVSNEQN